MRSRHFLHQHQHLASFLDAHSTVSLFFFFLQVRTDMSWASCSQTMVADLKVDVLADSR